MPIYNTKRLENRRRTLVDMMSKNLSKQQSLRALNETYSLEIVKLNNEIMNYEPKKYG